MDDTPALIIDILQDYSEVFKKIKNLPKNTSLLSNIDDVDDSNELINSALREVTQYKELMEKNKKEEYTKLFDEKGSYKLLSKGKTIACCELIIPLLIHKTNKKLTDWDIKLNE